MALYHRFGYYNSIKLDFKTTASNNVLKYTVKYASGVQSFTTPYTVRYTSVYLSNNVLGYTVKSTYEYDDKAQSYRVLYTSGVEILDRVDRYRIRYVSDNPAEYKLPYRVVYNSEVVPTDLLLTYKTTYTSEYLSNFRNAYTVRYDSIGIESIEHRTRWSVKYTSQSLGDYVVPYKIKYTTSIFYDNSTMYIIKYTSEGSEEILTRSALLQREDGTTDMLVEIKGLEEKAMDSYFYVLSNLPKYQLVEYRLEETLPYIGYVPDYELTGKDIFPEENPNQYEVKGYILVKDVNAFNPISVDIYDYETAAKINKAKSYFFDLSPSSFTVSDLIIGGVQYTHKNLESNRYEYGNLNFVYTEVTPIFSPGDSCCFSRKILPPGSPNVSGACSPF